MGDETFDLNWSACPAFNLEYRVQCHKFEGHDGYHVHQQVGPAWGELTSIQWEDAP